MSRCKVEVKEEKRVDDIILQEEGNVTENDVDDIKNLTVDKR